ncbi:PepSY domain-containing protein [Paenibacillus thiaminolyticus]|uniref:PepSY domain-containing protein n=1 Tax=Paenibacillus thiaminolyticus TaxID=49283 RepID=UPI002543858A|nr:PepSY domain-containing protein [Paenibacillus thiaminolyticus]WII36691.1 PepSY domain-containing protein [Paenibacillus thiaminolyticus]
MKKAVLGVLALVNAGMAALILFSAASEAHAVYEANQPVEQVISEQEAKSIALQQVKGRVLHVDLDTDNGKIKYEVIIMTDQNKVFEVEIDAQTGKVLKVEQED